MGLLHFFAKNKLKKYLYDENGKYLAKWINFEFNSSCCLRCKWCTLDHSKKREIMSKEILSKGLDELTGNKYFEIKRIDLHNAGETLLHPNLKGMLEIITEKRKKFENQPIISLLSNAYLLDEKKAADIIESNALDEIRFSVDGGTKNIYEDIRAGSNWTKVRDNIHRFLALNKGKINTGVICIIPNNKDLSTEWMEDDFKELFSKIDGIELRRPHNWDGSRSLNLKDPYTEEAKGRVCKFLLKNLVILPNGDVTVCCADLNSRGVVGNILENNLEAIFFSLKRLRQINLFAKRKKYQIKLCKSCSGYYE